MAFSSEVSTGSREEDAQNKHLNFDLIIFDCDGVLVDSEVISCRAHAEILTRYGYPITSEQVFDRFLGRSTRQAHLEVEAELGRSLPDDFNAQLQDELYRSFEATLRAVPHIDQALDAITQAVCVASSGSQERMRVSLGCAGLYDKFAPNIFRHAGQARQAGTRSVPVRRRADAGRARTLPRDRGQRSRRHRRRSCRDDRARLSRRQPLPPRLWRHLARRRGGRDI
jgi:hypothetical protein